MSPATPENVTGTSRSAALFLDLMGFSGCFKSSKINTRSDATSASASSFQSRTESAPSKRPLGGAVVGDNGQGGSAISQGRDASRGAGRAFPPASLSNMTAGGDDSGGKAERSGGTREAGIH